MQWWEEKKRKKRDARLTLLSLSLVLSLSLSFSPSLSPACRLVRRYGEGFRFDCMEVVANTLAQVMPPLVDFLTLKVQSLAPKRSTIIDHVVKPSFKTIAAASALWQTSPKK